MMHYLDTITIISENKNKNKYYHRIPYFIRTIERNDTNRIESNAIILKYDHDSFSRFFFLGRNGNKLWKKRKKNHL